jgi:hypothetical protein
MVTTAATTTVRRWVVNIFHRNNNTNNPNTSYFSRTKEEVKITTTLPKYRAFCIYYYSTRGETEYAATTNYRYNMTDRERATEKRCERRRGVFFFGVAFIWDIPRPQQVLPFLLHVSHDLHHIEKKVLLHG